LLSGFYLPIAYRLRQRIPNVVQGDRGLWAGIATTFMNNPG
jgi:hypothetical protein